jgi:hypothetical protein
MAQSTARPFEHAVGPAQRNGSDSLDRSEPLMQASLWCGTSASRCVVLAGQANRTLRRMPVRCEGLAVCWVNRGALGDWGVLQQDEKRLTYDALLNADRV